MVALIKSWYLLLQIARCWPVVHFVATTARPDFKGVLGVNPHWFCSLTIPGSTHLTLAGDSSDYSRSPLYAEIDFYAQAGDTSFGGWRYNVRIARLLGVFNCCSWSWSLRNKRFMAICQKYLSNSRVGLGIGAVIGRYVLATLLVPTHFETRT